MHAIRQYEFGPAENLRYEEVPDPHPGAGQVRVAVKASGVHLIDTVIRSGAARGPAPLPDLPMTPGREVAGVIDEVGDGVGSRWLGKRVTFHLGPASGGYAELAVGAADALRALPDDVTYETAVAMIGTGRTALGVLRVAQPAGNDVVLVTSAAGGMGTLLVQAARNLGATVVGLAGGPAKVAQVSAPIAVDYTRPEWARAVREALGDHAVTVAFDGVGGDVGRAAFELLGPGGRLIMFGWSSGTPTRFTSGELYERGLSATFALPRVPMLPGGMRGLEEAALAEAAAGRLVPAVHTFRLEDTAKAHAALESRATTGKVVLIP